MGLDFINLVVMFQRPLSDSVEIASMHLDVSGTVPILSESEKEMMNANQKRPTRK